MIRKFIDLFLNRKNSEEARNLTNDREDIILCKQTIASKGEIKRSYIPYNDFVVLDVTTTGYDELLDGILEITLLKYKNRKKIKTFNSIIKRREGSIPFNELNVSKNRIILNGRESRDVFKDVFLFIEDMPIVSHNVNVHIKFLNIEFSKLDIKIKNKIVDTFKIATVLFKNLDEYKSEDIKKYLEIEGTNYGSAGRCTITSKIYLEYIKKATKRVDLDLIEENLVESIKNILEKNNRDLDYIKVHKIGLYKGLDNYYSFIRFKKDREEIYLLTHLNFEEVGILNLKFEDVSLSEQKYKSRVYLKKVDDIYKLEEYILKEHDNSTYAFKTFKENIKSSEYDIVEYFIS